MSRVKREGFDGAKLVRMSKAEQAKLAFPTLCKQSGLPEPEREYPFSRGVGRKHRFDYCWPQESVALECDGGVWSGGRHTRGSGWMKDTEKLNLATTLGWRLLRCTPDQLCTPEMIETIKKALEVAA